MIARLCILSVAVALAGCSFNNEHEEEEHEDETFLVTNVIRTDTVLTHEYVCQIRAHQHIDVRALERGYLERILVNEGQRVKKGQLMFQIMPVLYQAEYAKVAAELRMAEIEYQNSKSLADSNVVSKNELAIAKARLDRVRAELALAQTHVEFTKIKAPFDGIVDRLLVRQGSLLEEGDVLTALSDNSEMWVYFNVAEAQYLNYSISRRHDSVWNVRLRMANQDLFPYEGRVTTIEGDFNSETGNIAYRATFPNPDGLLRHGETGNIIATEPLKNVLLVPQKATFEVLDKKLVYVVDTKGVVHSRVITVIGELPHLYVVGGGVNEGDLVLLEGLRKVEEGQAVSYRKIPFDSVQHSLQLHAE